MSDPMTPEDQAKLQESIDTIADILYRNAPTDKLDTLEGIEQTVRQQTQTWVMPQIGIFLSEHRQRQRRDTHANSRAF